MLIVIGLGWLTPLLAMQGNGELPACCRRDGKHQCSRMGKPSGGASVLFTTQADGYAVAFASMRLRPEPLPEALASAVTPLRPWRGPPLQLSYAAS
jgi:hypothetical protein